MLNISKKRKWKVSEHSKLSTDLYFVYNLHKKQRGDYLNTWFVGIQASDKKDKNIIYTDEMITFKQCDEDTIRHLYQRKYNPVSLDILCPAGAKFTYNKDNEPLYDMKFQVHSIDDSSFGIWWIKKPLKELYAIRDTIMNTISNIPVINGENLLNYCIELGADETQKDYN